MKTPDAEQMVEDIRSSVSSQNGIELSVWEEKFISVCTTNLRIKLPLTQKQLDKLEEIWDRV